ncbi:MAG: hypothetical protein ACJ768_19835 [Gaiellaceae bacterium]
MHGRGGHIRHPRRLFAAVGVTSVAAVSAVAGLPFIGGTGAPAPQPAPPPSAPGDGPDLFAPSSFWNKPLAASAPVDPSSKQLVTALAFEVARERARGDGPWIQTHESSTPLYTVPADQPTVTVHLDRPARAWNASMRSALSAVPLPPKARPAYGSDRHLTVWQPSTDRLWELYRAHRAADGWHAGWGGAIQHVSANPGYYDGTAWHGARPDWGATATSLPVIGGTMLVREIESGHINHALAFNVPDARANVFAWPAQRSDGTGPTSDLPEGARLRLDPTLDVASLNLPPLARMMAEAAQRYGIVVRDRTHQATAFFAEDTSPSGNDPYHGANGLFGGQMPDEVLANFPWKRLQVLKMRLCTSAPCSRGGSP